MLASIHKGSKSGKFYVCSLRMVGCSFVIFDRTSFVILVAIELNIDKSCVLNQVRNDNP